jgi:uncharacterized protein YukE
MKRSNIYASAAKLELALKTLRTTIADVDSKWTDSARHDFQETYLDTIEPNVKNMLEAISHLTSVLAGAERDCGDTESAE